MPPHFSSTRVILRTLAGGPHKQRTKLQAARGEATLYGRRRREEAPGDGKELGQAAPRPWGKRGEQHSASACSRHARSAPSPARPLVVTPHSNVCRPDSADEPSEARGRTWPGSHSEPTAESESEPRGLDTCFLTHAARRGLTKAPPRPQKSVCRAEVTGQTEDTAAPFVSAEGGRDTTGLEVGRLSPVAPRPRPQPGSLSRCPRSTSARRARLRAARAAAPLPHLRGARDTRPARPLDPREGRA